MESRKQIKPSWYFIAWAVLAVFAGLSWGISYVDMGWWKILLLLTIACISGFIITFVFMHLYEATFASQMTIVVAALFIVILVLVVFADVVNRASIPRPRGESGRILLEAPPPGGVTGHPGD